MDTKKKIPKYKLIENDIIDQINKGRFLENDALPTEESLAKEYGVSRVTVRQALANLESKGFIRKTHGSGSYVNKIRTIKRTTLLKSFTEEMRLLGKESHSDVHSFNISEAGSTMANILGIEPTDKIYYIERTRYADEDPVLYERTYLSVALHPTLSMNVLLSSKYQYGDEAGIPVDYSLQNINPVFAPEYIAKELNISATQPIIRIDNTSYLKDGTVFDFTELFLHPELYQLSLVKKR